MEICKVIKHCEEQSSGGFNGYDQLAAWLKELVLLRENQVKYEKALQMIAESIEDGDRCGICPAYNTCDGNIVRRDAIELIVSEIRRINGIEVTK